MLITCVVIVCSILTIYQVPQLNISYIDPILHTDPKLNLTPNCVAPKFYPQVHLLQYLNPSINASCELLFKGDKQERQRIRNALKSWKPPNDTETIKLIKDCQHIRTEFMDNFYISETERNFPLAFQCLYIISKTFYYNIFVYSSTCIVHITYTVFILIKNLQNGGQMD